MSVAEVRSKPPLPSSRHGLREEIASELLATATSHSLKAGDILFAVGDRGDGCYWLDKGVLKVSLTSPQGAERMLAVLSEGSIVGDLAMIDGLPRSTSVVALTGCELHYISQASFRECAQRHLEIFGFFVALLAARLREAEDVIAAMTFLTVKGRVARALLAIADNLGEKTDSGESSSPTRSDKKISLHWLGSHARMSIGS